jgi:hypothetical protein
LRPLVFRAALAACVLGSVLSSAAAMAAAPVVVPPALTEMPPPELLPDEEITIEFELTVTAAGHVENVKVLGDPLPEYAEQAKAALARAHVTAATKDGVSVAARIRYAYVFPARPKPQPEPVASPVTTLPKPQAPPPAPSKDAPEPPLPSDKDEASFGARAVTEAPPRETTTRSMGTAELRMLGTRGDPIRAVELLPGFARTTLGNSNPIIRGSAGYESQVFFEGAPVPILYHFGGITSFVPARFIDRVDFYPGNFSARYGRVLGGVIDVRARDPKSDGFHGGADLSFFDASAFLEGPLAGRTGEGQPDDGDSTRVTAAVGARRSHVDFYLGSILPKDTVRIQVAPVYYDYQGIVAARFSERHQLRVIAYGSSDQFTLISDKPSDDDPGLRGRFSDERSFHRVQATLKSRLSEHVTQEATASVGTEKYKAQLGPLANQDIDSLSVRSRFEWTIRPVSAVRFMLGVDHASQHWGGAYDGLRPQLEGSSTTSPSVTPRTSLRADFWTHTPALYAEAGVLLGERVMLIPSLRSDYLDQIGALTLDPRLAVRAKVAPSTTLKGGVGKFTQHPLFYQAMKEIGNPNLGTGYAVHFSAGVEQTIGDNVFIGSEVFLKTLHDLPVDVPGHAAPYFDNQGRGRVYGLETEARVSPKNRVYGLIAYTLSRSERGRVGEPLRLFESDQTHVGSAAAVVRIGAGWEASATFRLTSANPRTAVVGSVFDAASGTYSPRYGATLADRGPLYHRLDLHVEKNWLVSRGKITAYLDIQNVYNASNSEFLSYNYDYTKSAGSPSFPPFLPSLGVRGEL